MSHWRRSLFPLIGLALVVTGGCTSSQPPIQESESANREAAASRALIEGLRSATTFTLHSLQPYRNWEDGENAPVDVNFERDGDGFFLGWTSLGSTDINDPATRRRLIDALEASIPAQLQAACFEPRHGIRASDGVTTYDLIICFSCGQLVWHANHESRPGLSLTRHGRETFDTLLTEAGIAIVPSGLD